MTSFRLVFALTCLLGIPVGVGAFTFYPWANGLRVEEIEAYYDAESFSD